ncbi:MAG: S8 family peptidase [Saprospiraceae bacterium]|nr:S8 family peptidase [Saprospiraceae bacterium]
MRTIKFYFLSTILCLFSINTLSAQQLDHVLGEVIIKVKNDQNISSLLKELSADPTLRSSLKARQIMKEPMNLWVVQTNPNEVNELKFLTSLAKNKNVLLAQQNHITQLRAIPNDPNFANQWQYINTGQSGGVVGADIEMDLAWDITTGGLTTDGDTIVVCIIDDGINPEHPDLGNNLWINYQEIPDNGIDDDGNGYVDDIRGWNAYNNSDNVYVDGSHGTPVAGIVGAKGNNEIGVAGVNWDVKLMIVRGGSPEATALASYAYPYMMRKLYNETNGEKGAFVVSTNASWGIDFGDPEDAPIWCEFYNMLGEVGILNFGATINGNTNVDEEGDLPTACESNYLVSVTNMNRQDEKVNGAGYGLRTIDIGAYGAQAYTLTSSAYGGFGGTSGATPHVAGTAALLYSTDCESFTALAKSNPAQAALVVKDCILHGVTPNQTLLGRTTTGGKLNAFKSVENMVSMCGDCTEAFGGEVGEITDKMGVLTWYDNGNIGSTSIRYKDINDTDWIEVENVIGGFEFTNLNACSSYEYQTKTICPSNPDAEYTYSRVFETDGCCEIPNVFNVTLEGETAIVEWDELLAATNFIAEWKNILDTSWITVELGEENSFQLNDIMECEFYEIRIKSECENVGTESEFTEIFYVNGNCGECTREFCAFDEKNISDEWIESVEIESVFQNISGVSDLGYGNFLGQFDIQLLKNKEYLLNLVPGYSGNEFPEFFSAYIDYNQNGEFEESESIFISNESTTEAISGTFTIPEEAIVGISRMRIIMRFDVLNGPCDESGFVYGEIEEYCVTILDNTGCPSEFNTSVTDIDFNSLTFESAQNEQVESYLILYKEDLATDFDTVISATNEITITGLKDCFAYQYISGFICQGETFIDSLIYDVTTECEVASTESFDPNSLTIYPNPSINDLIINFEIPLTEDVYIEILSNDGRSINAPIFLPKSGSTYTIDTQDIPTGLFFIKVTSGEKRIIKKWMKI